MNGTAPASTCLLYLLLVLELSRHCSICRAFASSTIPLRPPGKGNIQDEVPSGFLADDDEECVIPPDEATVDHILNESALSRGLEIAGIIFSKAALPLVSSAIRNGKFKNSDEFWARKDGGSISNGEVLTRALEDLGPVYVKFGQALAARPDAIPLSLASSLSKLQDCMLPSTLR